MDRLSEIKAAIEYALREDYSVNGIDVCKRLNDALKHLESLQSDQCALPGWKLDPDMSTQELLLHMGELSEDEILIARAAIRWANSAALST